MITALLANTFAALDVNRIGEHQLKLNLCTDMSDDGVSTAVRDEGKRGECPKAVVSGGSSRGQRLSTRP